MRVVTDHVSQDEPCYGLYEGPSAVNRRRWVNCVYVVRGDELAEYTTDVGPVEDYERTTPMMVPSFGENTVAQLQEFAVKNRHDEYWANRSDEMLSESTLIKDHIEQEFRLQEFRKMRSHFGPLVSVQRSG